MVQSGGTRPKLLLLAIDGSPPPFGAIRAPNAFAGVPGAGTDATAARSSLLAPGTTIPSATTETITPTIGITVTTTLLRPFSGLATVPQSPSATPSPGLDAVTGITPNAGSVAISAGQGSGIEPEFPAGTRLSTTLAGYQLPGQPTVGSTPSAVLANIQSPLEIGSVLQGTITGVTSGGHAIAQTSVGPVQIAASTILPPGTVVILEVASAPQLPQFTPAASPFENLAAFLDARNWPTMEEAVAVLAGARTADAHQLSPHAVARPDAAMTTGVLFFLTALRGGDLAGWIGEGPARLLSRLRPDLSARLGEDFHKLGRLTDDPSPGDWRTIAFPLLNGDRIEMVRLLLRHGKGNGSPEDGETGDRFVVDVSLSRIGRFQIDGLFRNRRKRIDLIVRTDGPLPPAARDDLRRIVRQAGEDAGLDCALAFQANPPSFVDIVPKDAPSGGHGIVV